jgi:ribosomal-protein-alanine N-acetyltransferase
MAMNENMKAMMVTTAKGIVIKIRNFEMSDIRRVMEIEEESFLDGDAGLYLELYEEWPEGFLVAEKDDEILGFVVLVLTPEGEGRVFALAVDSRYRGRGVGRALLKTAFNVLRKRKIGYVQLEVRVSNQIARRLYRSVGFMETGFIPFYYKNGEGAIIMRKVL